MAVALETKGRKDPELETPDGKAKPWAASGHTHL